VEKVSTSDNLEPIPRQLMFTTFPQCYILFSQSIMKRMTQSLTTRSSNSPPRVCSCLTTSPFSKPKRDKFFLYSHTKFSSFHRYPYPRFHCGVRLASQRRAMTALGMHLELNHSNVNVNILFKASMCGGQSSSF